MGIGGQLVDKLLDGLLNWLLRRVQEVKMLLIILLSATVILLSAYILLMYKGPLLIKAGIPIPQIIEKYRISEIVPERLGDTIQVINQRKVFHLDIWNKSRGLNDCRYDIPLVKLNHCDQTHIIESWTIIVPDDPKIQLVGIGETTGSEYGSVEPLTPHIIVNEEISDNRVKWYIQNDESRKGNVDVIILERTVRGGFQPHQDTKNENLEVPKLDSCKEDAAGIYFHNPTGRAEMMVLLSGNPPVPGGYKIWKRVGIGPAKQVVEEKRFEAVKFLGATQDRIYWNISQDLLKDAHKGLMLWLSWEWKTASC